MLKPFFGTATFRQSSVTFSATVINGLLGLAFFGLLAQVLGVANFGVFNVVVEVLALVAGVANLGTDTGLVNFISRYKLNHEKLQRFLKVGLFIKLLTSIFIIIAGYALAPFIALEIFQKAELIDGLRLAAFGVASSLLFSFTTSVLQGYQKFKIWGAIQIATNLLRLILLSLLGGSFVVNSINPELLNYSLLIYILMPAFGFFVGFLFISPSFLQVKGESKVLGEFLHYNKWIAAMAVISAISSRLDTFIAARVLEISAVGLYSAANRIAYVVPQIVTAVGTVVAPKMAAQTSLGAFLQYFKKVQIMVGGLCLLGLLAVPASVIFIPLIFGSEFMATIPIFWVLLVAMLIFLFSVPVHTAVIFYFSYSKLFFWTSIGHFILVITLGWYLVINYGAMGAAFAVLLGNLFNFLVPAIWLYEKVRTTK